MTRAKRRIIFYTLTLIFLIAGPLLVAYSLGYVYDFSTASLEQTGGVFVKAETPRLAVFFDNTFVRETSLLTGSAFLTDIREGTHLVRLEKQDFHPWSKTVSVEPATVTELRDIVLIPQSLVTATSSLAELSRAEATSTPPEALTLNGKHRLLAGRGKSARVILENVHSFAGDGDDIFFVDQNGFFARLSRDTGTIATIGRPGFVLDDGPLRFIIGAQRIALIDPSGGLFLYDKDAGTLTAVASEILDASFDGKEEKLLLRKRQSIAVLWLADNSYQPLQKKGILEEVLTDTAAILEARWFYATDAHVVWRMRDGIYFAEIDHRGGINKTELVSDIADELLTYPSVPNAIFWRIGKNIYKTEL